MESGVCEIVSEFDIAGTEAVYIIINVSGGTLCFVLPPDDARAVMMRVEGRRQRFTEIRKAAKRSVVGVDKF